MPGSPLPYFYPMVTPAGMPLQGYGPPNPMEDSHSLVPAEEPELSFIMSPNSTNGNSVSNYHEPLDQQRNSPYEYLQEKFNDLDLTSSGAEPIHSEYEHQGKDNLLPQEEQSKLYKNIKR